MRRLLALIVLSAAVRSLAQEEIAPEALKKMPPLVSREELGVATALTDVVVAIDEAFASQNGNEAPKAPFTIVIPTGKGLVPAGRKEVRQS